MNKPLVSIVIPTFNRFKYLERAINSALNQTYKKIEIIVIDDNSNDETYSVIKNLKDDRIHYYKNNKNKGPSFSRNKGIRLSKGEYINFLDDDDEFLPKKIELQINKFNTSQIKNLGVVICDIDFREKGVINGIKTNHKKGNIYRDLLKEYCIYGTHPLLIKRKFCKFFDLNMIAGEEYDLKIRLSRVCNFDYVPKCLAIKNQSINQITFNFKQNIEGIKYLFKKYRSEFLRFGIRFYIFNWLRFKALLVKNYFFLYFGYNNYIDLLHRVLLGVVNRIQI